MVTNVRRTSERTSARVSERVNGRVRTSGRTCARTCVRLHVHWPRARARTKIRSTGVSLRRLNYQKWSEHGVLCLFLLGNVLRAIATSRTAPKLRCFAHFDLEMCFALQRSATFHFSSGQMAPHPAALARLLFDPLEPQIIGKTQ